jgi:molybdopterin biosynthesis enzyme
LSSELIKALNEIEKDRGIPKSALIDAIKSALNTAYKKNFGIAQTIDVDINEITGEVQIFSQKKVVALENSSGQTIARPLLGKSGLMSILSRADAYIHIPYEQQGILMDTITTAYLF